VGTDPLLLAQGLQSSFKDKPHHHHGLLHDVFGYTFQEMRHALQ
jgi:hypothetical protein